MSVLACLLLAACGGGAEEPSRSSLSEDDDEDNDDEDNDDDDDDDDEDNDDEDDDDSASTSMNGKRDAATRDAGGASGGDAGANRKDGGRADAGVTQPGVRDSGAAPGDTGGEPTKPGGGSVDISSCTPPPEGSSEKAVQAWTLLNEIRLAAGAGCINMVAELNTSAQSHCDYKVANRGNASCMADAHSEIMGCTGFTGADVQAREIAAGYPRQLAYTEVALTYGDNPAAAIPGWIDTVWHRIPLLDPWTADMGWGGAAGCDVIDLGRGMSTAPADLVAVYPYDGQTNVPPSFSGIEGPAPPPPPGGWPSAYPINVYAQRIMVTEHVLTKDGDDTPIDHLWLDSKAPEVGALRSYFTNTVFLYGAPFELNTKYRVKIVGTYAGGALNVEWTFTTGSRRPFGA